MPQKVRIPLDVEPDMAQAIDRACAQAQLNSGQRVTRSSWIRDAIAKHLQAVEQASPGPSRDTSRA